MKVIKLINKIILVFALTLCMISCDEPPIDELETYTITYHLDSGACDNLKHSFLEGEYFDFPIPQKEGYDFVGWYEINELNEKIFVTEITKNKNYVIYAEWTKKEVIEKVYTVYFENCDLLDVLVKEGSTLEKPNDLTKEGYKFIGWYEDESLNKVYDFTKPVDSDLHLYPKWEENEIFEIVIVSMPNDIEFYDDEAIDLTGLEVELQSNKNKINVTEKIDILYDIKLGENIITVLYDDYSTSFSIYIIEREKEVLNNHSDYKTQTIASINYLDYKLAIKDIRFATKRDANVIIAFAEENLVKTNIYGYEILIDEYGKIIDKSVNVTIDKNCMIISAHGTRAIELKNLELGDYTILINGVLYIYDGDNISKANSLFLRFYELLNKTSYIESIKTYNEVIEKLNSIIPHLDSIYSNYDEELAKLVSAELDNIQIEQKDIYNHKHSYTTNDTLYNLYDYNINNISMYQLYSTYTGAYEIGGFRNSNSIHYYDINNYRERNSYGYEIAVDKNGIIIDKDVLVDLPEDGFILSGHTSGAEFLINFTQLYDKIILTGNSFEVHRDNTQMMYRTIYTELNELILGINSEKEEEIPHDYEYIDDIISLIDSKLNGMVLNTNSLYDVLLLKENYEDLINYIALGYSQLVRSDIDNTKGIWYYPFRNNSVYDDTSIEGIQNTMKLFKEMGINEIVINPFYGNYSLFENSIYELSDVLTNCTYGDYGNDYLKCFIDEAHKVGIKVNAFTQTFANNSTSFKDKTNSYYQIDYQGEKSLGSIYYYDICNDNLQEMLLVWYKELVTKYEFDKIEYDIIRYPSSNLYKYTDIDTIPESVMITDHGYTEYTINKFMNEFGYSGDLKELVRTSKEVRNNWLLFKERELVSFITNCSQVIKEINPDIVITAAVLNDYDNAKKSYLQDCKKWLELGILYEIETMVYTVSVSEVEDKIKFYQELVPDYNVRIGLSSRLDTRDIILDFKQMILASKYNGYILFANNIYYDNEFIKLMSLSNHN